MPVAIGFSEYGPPEVLHPIEIGEPSAAPGEVRVRVKAAGIAPFDCRLRRGEFAATIRPGFPHRLGNEFAGVVDQVGAGIADLEPGAEVFGFTVACAYAEVITVPADQVARKPASLPWQVAAALPVAGQGAISVVRQLAPRAGDVVLVHAAAGGIGSLVVQLARRAGARVLGTASAGNHEFLRALGAEPVTYGDGLAAQVRALAPEGVSAALDAVGGDAVAVSLALGASPGRIVCLVHQNTAVSAHGITPLVVERSARVLTLLAGLAGIGELRVTTTAFDLADAAAAHRRVESGHGRGKTVLIVNP